MTRTPLSDDHLWVLVNRDQNTSLAELARRFGCPPSTVSMAAKRIRDRGWTCTVSFGVCSVCRKSFTRQGHKAGRREYHRECRPQALKQLNTGYDERRWREADDETRRILLDRAHAYTRQHQAESLERATNRGARWQSWEDDFLLANPEMTTSEVASELGRTLYAVTARRLKLKSTTPVRSVH
jgi:DNA-binding MarR family transcriptional regulator